MAQRQGLTMYRMVTIALFLISTAPFAAAVLRGIVRTINYTSPVYTVAIDSVGGLDADLGAPVSPVFNLTLRIDERTGRRDACIGHRAAAAVEYRGLVLGRGPAPEFCVDEATGAAEAPAVAWGTDIKIPEFLRGQLREELSRGEAAFSVAVRVPNDRTAGNGPDVVFECAWQRSARSPRHARRRTSPQETVTIPSTTAFLSAPSGDGDNLVLILLLFYSTISFCSFRL